MRTVEYPGWIDGGNMPDEIVNLVTEKIRAWRKQRKMAVDLEKETAFIEAITPLVHNFFRKERMQREERVIKNLMTRKHAGRKKLPQTEHVADELKAVKDACITAIYALQKDGLRRTSAARLEQALFERVGDLRQLAEFMPRKRGVPHRTLASCLAVWGKAGLWRLPTEIDEIPAYLAERRPSPTIDNLCALLWAVVDIIDPSVSPARWDANEGLEAQARLPGGSSGATRKADKEEFLTELCRLLHEAIGRIPGRKAVEDMAWAIFDDALSKEFSWDAEGVCKKYRERSALPVG